MFQSCYSLVTLSFKRRSILKENSAVLKWKWETFYLENVKLNRLIFFIIKMSKWMLLLFAHIFSTKSIPSSETISATDTCTTFLQGERGTQRTPRAQEPHSWDHPQLMGVAHEQMSVHNKPLWPPGLVWKKAMRRGNTTWLFWAIYFSLQSHQLVEGT